MIGRRLGRYRVTEKIGQGGMATVWKAEDELLGRTVAVKVLAETLAGSPDARRRFLHEARAAALLDHPGIVTVHDAGETEGVVWLAMALVDGDTLAERIARRLMPLEEAACIVCATAEALSHAHARGIVHRDVTSRNVMIARDGRVVVLDFGLALVEGESRVTTTGTTLGTLSYLSPEVAAGHTADPRSDVYGLGVVLYEALTGALPFGADRPEALLYAIVNQPAVPPRARRPEIPEALERVVLRAMARQPEDRFSGADEFAAELRSCFAAGAAATEAAGEPPPGPCGPPVQEPGSTVERGQVTYLAVLPFEDPASGAEPGTEGPILARGLAESVAAALGGRPGLRVIPPAPAGADDGESATTQSVARRLGANLLLRGTVRHSGMQVRLTWSLLDPRLGAQTAGGAVDGSTLELFELEDRLVADVRGALGIPVEPLLERPRSRPRDPAAHERYIRALGFLQRYDSEADVDGAIAELERLLTSEGDQAHVHAALGRACLYKHRLTSQRIWVERAASACERALALAPDDPEVLVTRGDLREIMGRHTEAIADYGCALERRPDLFEALLGLARSRTALGDMPGAEEAARQAIAARSRDWRAYSFLGFVYFQEGQYARAIGPWRRAVKLSPDNTRALANLGGAYFQLGRLDDAAEAFERSVETEPNATGYRNLGTALYYLGRYEEATAAFEKAIALTPLDPLAVGNLGCAFHYMPGRERDAVAILGRAVTMARESLQRNPNDVLGLQRLAGWLGNLGRFAEACEAMDRALALAPHDSRNLAAAAGLRCQMGDRSGALGFVTQAVQAGYSISLLERSPELAPLREDPKGWRTAVEAALHHSHRGAAVPRKGGAS